MTVTLAIDTDEASPSPLEDVPPVAALRKELLRVTTIGALLLAFVATAIMPSPFNGEGEAYPLVAYVALALAGLWWGRRGIAVGVLFCAAIFFLGLTGLTAVGWWTDVVTVSTFLVVGTLFGLAGEHTAQEQRRLRTCREQFGQLVDKSLTGIVVYSDETIRFVNHRMEQILGVSKADLVGRPVWDLVHPKDLCEVKSRFQDREERGYSELHYEARFARSDGAPVWVDVTSTKMRFDGMYSVQLNVFDISSGKRAAQREIQLRAIAKEQGEQLVHSARLAELGELAASIAHEVNQPLTGIRNYARNAAYMLEHHVGEAGEVEQNLEKIAAQVDRAADIIRTLQQLSRRSNRKMEPVDINELIVECLQLLETNTRLSSVEVDLSLQDDLPRCMGDRIRIEQVVLNLLTNAIHSLDHVEERVLRVSTSHDHESNVVIEVSDTGLGFANADRQKLFRPFYTTRENGEGTGLGLSISLSVVEEHQGTIEAKGTPGQGATFKVRLPSSIDTASKD